MKFTVTICRRICILKIHSGENNKDPEKSIHFVDPGSWRVMAAGFLRRSDFERDFSLSRWGDCLWVLLLVSAIFSLCWSAGVIDSGVEECAKQEYTGQTKRKIWWEL